MNQAFNQKSFCQVLYNACLYLRKLKSRDRDQIREHACGIFLYWNGKFKGEQKEKYVYQDYYEKLVHENGEFPSIPYIKEVKHSSKNVSKSASSATSNIKQPQITSKNIEQFLKDCQQVSIKTTQILQNPKYFSQINTNYVRLLKSKIQHIYSISTNAQIIGSLPKPNKDKLSELYKKIRGQLKNIQKINQDRMKQQSIKKQQMFLQEKIQIISPKKSQKQIPKLQITPTKVKKSHEKDNNIENSGSGGNINNSKSNKSASLIDDDFVEQQTTMQNISSNKFKGETDHNNTGQCIHDTDLLSMQITPPSSKKQLNNQSQQLFSKQQKMSPYEPQPLFSTPKKSSAYSNNSETESHGKFNKSNSQKQRQKQEINNDLPQAQMHTPVKKRKQYQQLIDLNQGSSDDDNNQNQRNNYFEKDQKNEHDKNKTKSKKQQKKTINFKQLYAANQISPQLKDIDLSGKKLSKQSIKSSQQDADFGDFV